MSKGGWVTLAPWKLTDPWVAGTSPDAGVASASLRLRGRPPDAVAARLRAWIPAVFARLHDGALVLDPRTVGEAELPELTAAIRACWDG